MREHAFVLKLGNSGYNPEVSTTTRLRGASVRRDLYCKQTPKLYSGITFSAHSLSSERSNKMPKHKKCEALSSLRKPGTSYQL